LADFVHAHHSITVIQEWCNEVVNIQIHASKKFVRCIPGQIEEFIG
jgi:hypothetical protein